MSRCIHLAFFLSIAACEHAGSTAPTVVTPTSEPVTVDPPPAAKPAPKELECKQVGSFQTRAGPRWVCLDKQRVRVVKESK